MTTLNNLPIELLVEIFKYLDNDHKSLTKCILINKTWHNLNIPTIWKDPFRKKTSVKILINCLLIHENYLLIKNLTNSTFELLEQPLHNYACFATELNFPNLRH